MISLENKSLVVNVDNYFRIVAQQLKPVTIDQLSATLETNKNVKYSINIQVEKGYFWIHPDSIGKIEIKIKLKDTIETKIFQVEPIVAVGRFANYKANGDAKISVGEFKAQGGIIASVECCGYDAKCTVLGYQVIRISSNNLVTRGINKAEHFDKNTRFIIDQAKPGDLFIFRNIFCRCPSALKPQRLDDMTFEIK
ncbi:MAG TPA: GldM family protein [Saprospiraceae bacterium]|nr:GldM family protein [Saprospiraceae bacterium]